MCDVCSCAGERCERCVGGPACGAGGVCVRDDTGAHCRADICRFFCLNGGTCSVSSVGGVACACLPAWSGERCQRPACVDAACTRPPAAPHDNDTRNNSEYSYTPLSYFKNKKHRTCSTVPWPAHFTAIL